MSYKITTIAEHQAMIDSSYEDKARWHREQTDVMDNALSSWASDGNIRAHRTAIKALELGIEMGHGEVPYCETNVLLDEDGNQLDAKIIQTKFGSAWIVSDELEAKFGRKFIPVGSRSRIQKNLGLKEGKAIVPAKRYLEGKCAGIGLPCYYYAVPA